ncbi:MAG: hypothetical protein D6798_17330 [Deltaproteobacteria bacterium]|nr:MAG: hypothetical protein D6798_17330 [Deltaproteobacteria bacterium]
MSSRLSILALLLAGCADMAFKTDDVGEADGAYADTGAAGPGATDDGDGGGDGYGSENEDSFFALAPATTRAYVFVANPDRDTVTRVTVPTLEVITTEVGHHPIAVATTSDYTKAVTFNEGDDTVSIIDADTLAVTEVAVRDDFNSMAMSPDGRWVMCWYDQDAADDGTDDGGVQSYNEVSFVDTDNLEHTPLVVGFNPRQVQFTDDSSTAVVVSDAYIAVIDLTADELEPDRIALTDDLVDPPTAEEVLLAPDGSYAFVRQFGATDLVVVDLQLGEVGRVAVGDNPTDLDLTPDGTRAIAVARGSNELWLYDLADPFLPPEVVDMPPDEVFGSLLMSPDGTRGLLYSTATGAARYASWELFNNSITVRELVKPVASMGVSPTGETALVFHPRTNGPDVDSSSPFYDQYALTMIDMTDDFFSNPLRLPAEPIGYAHSSDGTRGYFIMDGYPALEVLHYTDLLYDEIELPSNPVHVGVLPESRLAWVSEEHDLGRMSFYDPDTGVLQTITGFELNSGIEH